MNKYEVVFQYDGKGTVVIEAKNEEEAEEIFLSGEYEQKDINDDSDCYIVNEVNKV